MLLVFGNYIFYRNAKINRPSVKNSGRFIYYIFFQSELCFINLKSLCD